MFLLIDTTHNEYLTVGLLQKNKFVKIKASCKYKQSEKLLFFVDRLIKKNKVKLKDIKGILAINGPGGFTTVRIGIATSNALAFALGIKIASLKATDFENDDELLKKGLEALEKAKKGNIIVPFYDKEPNITKPKK